MLRLEQRLAVLTPKETVLLPNYPNSFILKPGSLTSSQKIARFPFASTTFEAALFGIYNLDTNSPASMNAEVVLLIGTAEIIAGNPWRVGVFLPIAPAEDGDFEVELTLKKVWCGICAFSFHS